MEKSSQQSSLAPHFALLSTQFMFGSFPVFGKFALQTFPSLALVGFRVFGAGLAFYFLQRLTGNLRLARKGDYWRLAVYSLLGVVANQLLFVKGLSLTTATNTSLLAVTIPVFATLTSAIIGNERLNAKMIAGISLAAFGVIYLIDPTSASFSSETTQGDLMIVFNCLFYASYLAISQDTIRRNGALLSITWMFLFGSLICLPIGAFSLSAIDLNAVGWNTWLTVLYLILFPTIGAYYLNAWSLTRVAPSMVAVYAYLQPLIGFILAVLFLGEQFTFRFVIAGALIFAGVFLVTRKVNADQEELIAHRTFP
ncbi:MAG: DMT family transporter [Acidobacteriota bacterium]|nr:DMT family transporter [Acidobacteriota bacterium]